MADIQSLSQKVVSASEFCRSELEPLIEAYQNKYPNLGMLTSERKKNEALVYGSVLLGALIAYYLNSVLAGSTLLWPATFLAAAVLAFVAWPTFKELLRINQVFRESKSDERKLLREIKKKSIQYLDKEFSYSIDLPFPKELYLGCGLFPRQYDRAHAEDALGGFVGETQFQITEIHTETIKKKEKNKIERKDIFKGLLLSADFNKNFTAHTIVREDYLEERLGFIGRVAQRLSSELPGHKLVELESTEFETQYKVTSTNPTEARYLLTPDFMERVLAVNQRLGSKIEMCFRNGTVLLAVPYDIYFDRVLSLNKLEESVSFFLSNVVEILSIIDELNMNQRIWNKKSGITSGQESAS